MKYLIRAAGMLAMAVILPVVAAQSPVIFNGGITLDERESAPTRGTKLEFFVSSGSFLSDIAVTVENSSGREIVDTVTEGPWLILDLSPGTYQVMATRGNGDTQSLAIDVSGEGEKFSFMFPGE